MMMMRLMRCERLRAYWDCWIIEKYYSCGLELQQTAQFSASSAGVFCEQFLSTMHAIQANSFSKSVLTMERGNIVR